VGARLRCYSASRPPNGRITLASLKNATLDIPAWPADDVQGPHGRLTFHDGIVTVPFLEAEAGRPGTGRHQLAGGQARPAFRRFATATGGPLNVELNGVTRSGGVLSEAVFYDNSANAVIRTVN